MRKENNVYIIDAELPKIDFSQKREIAERKIEAVYSKLIEFTKKNYNQDWSLDQATGALLGFLDQFGVEFLRAYIFKTALPEIPESGPRIHYIVSRFIRELHDHGDPVFEYVSVLVKGQMYANALVCPDLESLEKKFDNLVFFVDTPLVLNYFGLQGDEERAPHKSCSSWFRDCGVRCQFLSILLMKPSASSALLKLILMIFVLRAGS